MGNTSRPDAEERGLRRAASGPRRALADALTLPADAAPTSRERAVAPTLPAEPASQRSAGEAQGGAEPVASLTSRLPIVDPESYAVDAEVAQGGIGRVVRAEQRSLDRPVALKELLSGGGPDAEERFVREARLTARLQHPAIVPIYDAGRWPSGEPFYAMKLVTGRSFDGVIEACRSLAERLALLPHVRAAAEAIAYAHTQRVIHRDLKPANILVGEFGETVVIDWGLGKDLTANDEPPQPGIAAQIDPVAASEPPPSADPSSPQSSSGSGPRNGRARGSSSSGGGLTIAGAILGTPAFMPPEQAAGEAVDERADVYALGAILYHVLAGAPPYEGSTSLQILRRVKAGPPPPLEQRQRGAPYDLVAIVNKAMARDRQGRYPTARELADDLKRFETGQIVGSHRYSKMERLGRFVRRHRALLAVAGAALGILLLLGSLSVWSVINERDLAEAARDQAERAHREATARADELTLEQARAAVERDPNEALAWLKSLSPSFTEWRKARLIASDALARGVTPVLRGHSNGVITIEISRDGKLAATSSDDHTARIWDIATGQSRVLEGHTDEVWSARFSPDGKRVATAGKDKTLRIWDLATGASRVFSAGEDARELQYMVFLPDGETLATSEYGGAVRLWDAVTGESRSLGGAPMNGTALAASPDGARIAQSEPGVTVRVWDLPSLEMTELTGHTAFITCITFSPDGKLLASGSKDTTVRLWDLDRREPRVFEGHASPVEAVAFSPDKQTLASGGADGTVLLWDIATGASRALDGYGANIRRLQFSPDGALLAAVGDARSVKVWDLARGDARVLRGFKDAVISLDFAPDGKTLAAASLDHTARLFRMTALRDKLLGRHEGEVTDVAFSPTGAAVASASADKTARIWSLSGGPPIALEGHAGPVQHVAFSPSGHRLITADEGGTARVWDASGRALFTWALGAGVTSIPVAGRFVGLPQLNGSIHLGDLESGELRLVHQNPPQRATAALSPDGRSLAMTGTDQTVRIFDIATGAIRELTEGDTFISALAFSPDSKTLAIGGDHFIRFWDLERGVGRSVVTTSGAQQLVFGDSATVFAALVGILSTQRWELAAGTEPRLLRGHTDQLTKMVFSRATGALATASHDNTARLWDPVSGESRVLQGHTDDVLDVDLSPDGQLVATAGKDGAVRLWSDDLPFDPQALRARIDEAVPGPTGPTPAR